jgi:hypothetical protein
VKKRPSTRLGRRERARTPWPFGERSILFFGEIAGVAGAVLAVPVVLRCRSWCGRSCGPGAKQLSVGSIIETAGKISPANER